MKTQKKAAAKTDIRNREDIQLLVHTFYERVKNDDLLSGVINERTIHNWPDHLTLITEFWQTVLLDKSQYQGKPAEKHLDLPLTSHHFDRWITLFHLTLDDLYEGKLAEEAKFHAHRMAEVFRTKLHLTRF